MWNPSTCACECDMWCKPGQYLDYKKCVCKNKLIDRVIVECTSVINETMMNNKKTWLTIILQQHFYWIIFSSYVYWNCLSLRIRLF